MVIEDRVTLDSGKEIAYRLDGDLSKPVIMLVSGAVFTYKQFTAYTLPSLKWFLKDKYSYLLYDYVGYGESSDLEGKFDFELMAEQQLEFLDKLGVDKLNLYGFSKGSLISHIMTAKYPERVISLGAFGSPNPANEYARQKVRAYYQNRLDGLDVMKDSFDEYITDKNYDEVYDKIYIPAMFDKRKEDLNIIEKISAWYVRGKLKPQVVGPKIGMMAKLFSAFLVEIDDETREYYIDMVKSINVPVLHMHGRKDPYIPYSSSVLLSEWVETSTLHLFPRYMHNRPGLTPWQAWNIMRRYAKFIDKYN